MSEKITKAEAMRNLEVGIPVDWSQVLPEGEAAPEPEAPEADEPEVEEGTDDAAEEGSTEIVEEPAAEEPAEEPSEEDAEWEEAVRNAGGDPERDELAEANEVLSSSPVVELNAEEARAALEGLSPLQLLATVEHDTRKTVKEAAQALVDASLEEE